MNDSNPQKKRGLIRRFFGLIGAIARGLRAMLNLVVLLIFIAVIYSAFQQDIQPLPESAALILALEGQLVDQKTYVDPISQAMQSSPEASETLLRDVIDVINAAAKDNRITALVLDLGYMSGGGLSKLEEIGQALKNFKKSGKKIVAVGDSYTQAQYFLASYADEVHLNPMGALLISGFGSYPLYFKDALDKLKINVNVFRVGSYKDAIEPFTRDGMSPASKEHTQAWLDQLWNVYTADLEQRRGLPVDAVNDYVNNFQSKLADHNGNAAAVALDSGLVDSIFTRVEMVKRLQKLAGSAEHNDYKKVYFRQYLTHLRRSEAVALSATDTENRIGVVVAKGTILDGEQPQGTIGGDTLAALLSDAADRNFKALVLRIDSPGGSAFASDVIRQQLRELKASGIPIVVSMSSVAASGGYWIAADADRIWANRTTITGSIGVFGIIPTFDDSLAALGIMSDGVGTTELADIEHLERPMSDQAKAIIQLNVEDIYRQFIELVADAREQESAYVDSIAQGRVWSGEKARDLGLVDEIGSLKDAIADAASLAKIADYSVEYVTPPMSFYEQLLQQLTSGVASVLVKTGIADGLQQTHWLSALLYETSADLTQVLAPLTAPNHLYMTCFECAIE
ncbi:MAG: signal peptide peptidase SppA [bacterium]